MVRDQNKARGRRSEGRGVQFRGRERPRSQNQQPSPRPIVRSVPKPEIPLDTLVVGRNPVREVLRHRPDRVRAVFSSSNPAPAAQPGSRSDADIFALVAERGLKVQPLSFDALTSRVGTESHQGWVIEVSPRPKVDLKDVLAACESEDRGMLVLLDAVEDPQNLGSILRAAECFGADAVVWSRNRGAKMTPSVVKASAGASELVTLVEVGNLHDAIKKCQAAGWWVMGAALTENATSVFDYEGPRKIAVVMGAEGAGLHQLTLKSVDQTVAIPLKGRLDSLNVGQAAAVLLSVLGSRCAKENSARENSARETCAKGAAAGGAAKA